MRELQPSRPCDTCGFPTLVSLRRCPYCRETLVRRRPPRPAVAAPPSLLQLVVAAWLVPTAALITGLWLVAGGLVAMTAIMVALAPAMLWLALHGRWMFRLRGLDRRSQPHRRVRPRPPAPTEPSRPSPPDSGAH